MIRNISWTVVFFFAWASLALGAVENQVGKVIEVKGSAWKRARGSRVPVESGALLFSNEKLTTGSESEIKLVLGGKDVALLVKPKSEVVIEQLNGKDWYLELKSGAVLSLVKNPEKRPNHFRLRTHAATMGVRGTVFFVKDEGQRGVFLCTCVGTVEITSPDGKSSKSFTSEHHDAPQMIGSGAKDIGGRLAAAPMGSDHSDPEGEALVKLLE